MSLDSMFVILLSMELGAKRRGTAVPPLSWPVSAKAEY